MCCCRNEGRDVGDTVATLVLAFVLTGLDVTGPSVPPLTTPPEETIQAFLGVS